MLAACSGNTSRQTTAVLERKGGTDLDTEVIDFSNKMQLANIYSIRCNDIQRSGASNSDAFDAFYNEMFRRGFGGEEVNAAIKNAGSATKAAKDASFDALAAARGLTENSSDAEFCAAAKRDIAERSFVGQMIEVRG